ncbi:DUF3575 domain-containing protein [Bacteroides caecigallinarum]|uniref:DUF3575 domain-containing protein n=1 Tax=Bacteroides caecigallinarum TaxID=1411144 RepID=UPI001F296F8A|nr:DUF3575 domain-containing protein [Bacteroides caecigallinarum]MCF2581324.1 DUF3575 domain-containing protein [Bacteroides caecigallinarum]
MSKTLRTIATAICALFLLPLSAQEKADTVYTFRFVSDRDMFYVPYGGNDAELERLMRCVEQYRTDILSGETPLYVDGYSTAGQNEAENIAMSRVRSNRVKSELIVRQKLTEECFITKNHSGSGDYVTVRIVIPAEKDEEARLATERAEQERIAAERAERQRIAAEQAEAERIAREREQARLAAEQARADSLAAEQAKAEAERQSAGKAEDADSYTLSLRANFLRWATLTPDLGIEWRISSSVGIMVNGSWTSWTWQDNARRYALWEVMPEVRWYLGEKKAWYVGAMFKAGEFNYKLSTTGKQGDLMGGGITGGYQLPLTETLSMDFSLGLGYLNADTEKYDVIYGVRVRSGNETKHWVGPINAGVTLVWKIF